MSQAELAARAGLRQATLSALENGHTRPHAATVAALARALEIPVDQLRQSLRRQADHEAGDPVAEMGRGWPFLSDLAPDLRAGLASELVALWTHSSTALEGNTISLGDTLFVISEGLTVSGKSLREHQELHGHSQALALVASWARGGRPITIGQLHQLHRAVQTGAVIDSLAPVGKWKVEPNGTSAITTDGRTRWHDYARPEHVPRLIGTWLETLAKICRYKIPAGRRDTVGQFPPDGERIEAAIDAYTELHLGFVAIHPYADGNGRLARLLANLPLLRAGLPPLLIDSAQRHRYLCLLGDFSIGRGIPKPDEALVTRGSHRDAFCAFARECWQPTLELIGDYHRRQAERGT